MRTSSSLFLFEAGSLSSKLLLLSYQVSAQAADVVELFIYLGEPCHVCELLLTVAHGADDTTFPSTLDVRTGRNLDGLKLVLEVGYISMLIFHSVPYTPFILFCFAKSMLLGFHLRHNYNVLTFPKSQLKGATGVRI